jgi:hypothetical protein
MQAVGEGALVTLINVSKHLFHFLRLEHEREHITVWGNMNQSVTSTCYKINPNIPIFFR